MKFGKERILKPGISKAEHKNRIYKKPFVVLYDDKHHAKTYIVSRLVWEAFNGPIPAGYEVDHKDNNPENNRLDNLQLLTHKENNIKKYVDNSNGLNRKPIICLNTGIVYESIVDASRKLNLKCSSIVSTLKGRYKHTNGFTFNYFNGSI